ncbi:MAG TPA: hypothetical protein VKE93_16145 [Candidatus Angelobacter sp.]|nr:hypothetical protein [Candidatus Angelobacter sp.]
MAQKQKTGGFQISYVTITYRSVLLGILAAAAVVCLVTFFAFPDIANRVMASGQSSLGKVLAKVGLGGANNGPEPGPQQAHFTNIDGVVRVKKASSNTWMLADYNVPLERNDVIQTAPEGIAKVVFADGTNYTVKPDSLIVIQENSLNAAQQTEVSVQVTTGTVDLATSNISPGSRSQVRVAGTTASFSADTSAQVGNDPRSGVSDILAKKGSVQVSRGGENVKLTDNERVTIPTEGDMIKSKVIAPPILINPSTPQISLAPAEKGVTFSWSQVENVRGYHVSIARNQFFTGSGVVFDKTVTSDQIVLTIPDGAYFWKVRSIGDDGKESADSPVNRFSLVPRGANSLSIPLEVGDFVQIGHRIEVRGRTELGARVMVNGEEAVMMSDGTFRYLTNPLPTGENMITVTAQNAQGHYSNVSRPVTIQ